MRLLFFTITPLDSKILFLPFQLKIFWYNKEGIPSVYGKINLQKHPSGVLDEVLDLDQELHGFPAIQQAMVVGQGQVHHGADHDLAVDDDGLVLDGVKPEDGGLREVDNGGAHEGTEDAAVADGEGATGHILDGKLVVTSLGQG